MNKQEIEQKVKELQSIMSEYKQHLNSLEKELYRAISEYQKALEEEKVKEIRDGLS